VVTAVVTLMVTGNMVLVMVYLLSFGGGAYNYDFIVSLFSFLRTIKKYC